MQAVGLLGNSRKPREGVGKQRREERKPPKKEVLWNKLQPEAGGRLLSHLTVESQGGWGDCSTYLPLVG